MVSYLDARHMFFSGEPIWLTPRQMELAAIAILDGNGVTLQEFKSGHLKAAGGTDGIYDVIGRFSAVGNSFLVLVRCKREQSKVERQAVQVLHAKSVRPGHERECCSLSRDFRLAPSSTLACAESNSS